MSETIELEFVRVDVEGNNSFAVSRDGVLINYKTKKTRKPYKMKQGYLAISSWSNTKRTNKTFLIHRVVAQAFLGPCPPGLQVNHKNGNKLDNRVENLEYVTPGENTRHAVRHKLFDPRVGVRKLTKDQLVLLRNILNARRSLGVEYPENPILGKMFGVGDGAISLVDRDVTFKDEK